MTFIPAGDRPASPLLPQVVDLVGAGGGDRVIAIRPAAMPPGTTLHVVLFARTDGSSRAARVWLEQGDPAPCR